VLDRRSAKVAVPMGPALALQQRPEMGATVDLDVSRQARGKVPDSVRSTVSVKD
jgi:hypothetical protein